MSLPIPHLDDRRFQDLVDDAKRMVMRRCPEWTEHNVSDPGVTLIETFAFMTDQLLYRVNQVPDRLYLTFLKMLGFGLTAPTAARTAVTFWLSAPASAPVVLPRGTSTATHSGDGLEPVVFSTEREVTMPAARLENLLTLDSARGALVPREEHLRLDIDFDAFGEGTPAPGDALLIGLNEVAPRCVVRLDFECTVQGIGVDPDRPPLAWEAWDGSSWQECALHEDTTGGLNRPGQVVLQLPARHETSVLEGRTAGWLRAVVVPAAQDVPAYSSSPKITALGAGVVGATVPSVHAEVVEDDMLGTAEGTPGQRLSLTRSPVLLNVSEPVLETSSKDGWVRWQRVEHFADSGPQDRHYLLDPTAGTVCFGPMLREPDGSVRQHGAVPERDAQVRLRSYATGGGLRGNVAAGAIETLTSAVPFVTDVENLEPSAGGRDGESLADLRERAPLLLRTRDRAVTAEDYEVLARQAAPEIARVRCLAAGEPGVPAGSVKLLVVPAPPGGTHIRFEHLVPPEAVLERIAAHLEPRRLLGTHVLIEPPLYRAVTVIARVRARRGADPDQVHDDVSAALYGFLDPIDGGPEGTGWPFGRPVQTGDLYARLHAVDGVDLVEELKLYSANPVTGSHGEPTDRLELDPSSLVFSYEHHVRVEQTS
ncbi:putative baseplate assembly protein [Streptomyces sp. WAC06614]|uniref:putative baseplate assembly protein n=1 Tax=Streptomyces sp. WAC06614 TaxID=2487416 RepID=UPI000F799C70|nr:putative baseplate assembly protein [Streptomyces sp. WAC06614]RSS67420.1 putative baseplate assembly protein [Streptomyces sp. WAC06614]